MTTAWVSARALADIAGEAATHEGEETGGLVLGYWRGAEVVVTDVTGPGPDARHGSTWFFPDSRWQGAELARIYGESGRTITYLGDWHTHPGGSSRPSWRDQRTLHRIARAAGARQPRPLLGIVAPDPDGPLILWGYTGWFGRPVEVPAQVY